MIKVKDDTGKILFVLEDDSTEPTKIEVSLTESELVNLVKESQKKKCACKTCTKIREE